MLYSIENIDDLESLNELVSTQNQVKASRLQEKIGKQNIHEDMKKVFKPVTKTIKDASEGVTKTMTETSKEGYKAISDLNEKVLESMNDRGMIASYLVSPLINMFNPGNTSQFKLIEDPKTNSVNDVLINKIPVTLYDSSITLRDSNKKFELKAELLKMINDYKFNVDNSMPPDRKLIFQIAKEMKVEKATGNKSKRQMIY